MTGEQSGTARCWDHEDCPRDGCDGELQQVDRFNVMCLTCEEVWSHVKTETQHILQTVDFETVAVKTRVETDGGREQSGDRGRHCPSCGKFMPEDRGADVCIDCDDGLRADGGRYTLILDERQRERIESIKDECKEADPGLPKPSDEQVLKILLDTWEAVDDGLYSDENAFETLKPYWSVANDIESYVADFGADAAQHCRTLGWIALGGRGMESREDIAKTLDSVARNAESVAEKVRELDDPREIRKERGSDE